MVKYRKVGSSGADVEYEYFIEGGDESAGRIALNTDDGVGRMLDHEGSTRHRLYAAKVISHLEDLFSGGVLDDEGMVAWY